MWGKQTKNHAHIDSALLWISEIYPPTIHDSPETASFIHICRLRLYQYGRIGDSGSTAETQGSGKACRTPLSQPISPTACCSRTFIGAFRGPFYHQSDRKGRSWHNSKLSSPSPDMWAPIPRNSTRMACPMPVRLEWRAPDGISTIAHSNGKIFLPRGSR